MVLKHDKHFHEKECERFKDAMDTGHIVIINDVLEIKGKFPPGGKLVNIKDPEIRYDSDDYQYNVVMFYCPFCGKSFRRVIEKCSFCDGQRIIEGRNKIIKMNGAYDTPCSECNEWVTNGLID